jgi:hypothetical protein
MRYLIFLAVLFFVACNSNKNIQETPGGLKFEVIKEGKGEFAKKNDVVLYHWKVMDSNDSIWVNTFDTGLPTASLTGDPRIVKESPLKQMFRMVHPDDSIVINMTVGQYFNFVFNQPSPLNLDPSQKLKYQVKIQQILPVEGYSTMMEILSFRMKKKKIEEDGKQIDQFLTDKGLTFNKSATELRFLLNRKISKDSIGTGQTVTINWSTFLLDGRCVETTVESIAKKNGIYSTGKTYSPVQVVVDKSSEIKGLHLALKQLGKGDKGTFYIPSPLAYGKQGFGTLIKEDAILVFEIEILDVKDIKSSSGV